MKKSIIILGMLGFGLTYAQQDNNGKVGINTESPKTTFDVTGLKDANGNLVTTETTGIQPPRITLEELTNKGENLYGKDQTGAVVYITDISSGSATGQRININDVGLYIFDGEFWGKLVKEHENTTGKVIFSGSLGKGSGGVTAATISGGAFNTVPLSNKPLNIGGGVWDSTNYTYTVPVSGTYFIKSSVRVMDFSDYDRNIFQAVHTDNMDIPQGIWQIRPKGSSTTTSRWTMLYNRVAYFEKGDQLRLYVFSDEGDLPISDASLDIVLLTVNGDK